MVYFTYFGGGHLGFCSLAELAHIFTRWCITYFFKNFFLNQNQSSKIESEKVVKDSIGFASTKRTSAGNIGGPLDLKENHTHPLDLQDSQDSHP